MGVKKLLPILVLILLSSFVSGAYLADHQSAYWKFDGNATDATPNNNDAVTVTASLGTGIINQDYFFDGSEYIEVPDDTTLQYPTNTFSIEAWVKTTSTDASSVIMYKGNAYTYLIGHNGGRLSTYDWNAAAYRDNGVTEINDGDWHHTVMVVNSGTGQFYVDGSTDGTTFPYSIKTQAGKNSFIGSNDASGEYWEGDIDEVAMFDVALTQENITFLYAEGAPNQYQQYDYPIEPFTGVNDSTESTAIVRQAGSVSFVNPTSIVSSSFEVPINNTPLYGDYTFRVSANNVNDVYCEAIIDGNVVANKTRTQTPGDVGNMFIQFPTLTLRNDTGPHSQSLVCERISGVGLITIEETVGVGHFLVDEDNNIIPDNATVFNEDITSGSSFSLIDSFNITVGNKTTDDKYHSIVVEGMVEFTNNDASPEMLAIYGDINGTNCSTNIRDVGAGSSGSVSFDCAIENATANATYQINLYGNGTTANYRGNMVAKDLFLSDEEILGGTGILLGTSFSGNTPTRLFNGTGGNLNHDVTNVFQKVGYSILTDIDTTVDMYAKIINGKTYQTVNFTREFTGGEVGFLIGQDVLQGVVQDNNYSVELWANCGDAAATCEIVGGASLGYITDVTTTILNTFNVTAYNAWNGSQLLVFNATDGATFSTTNGLIEFVTEEALENITVSAVDYLDLMFMNHNTSNNINASIFQSVTYLNVKQKFSNTTINDATLVAEGNTIQTHNGTLILNPNLGALAYTINSTGYYDLTDTITITAATNETVRLWDSRTQINILNASDAVALQDFNVTLTYGAVTETYQTVNGSAYFNLTQNLTYDIQVDAVGFYTNTFTITPNTVTYQESFELVKVGNLELRILDSSTAEPITQLVNFTLTDPSTQQEFNFTGGNFTVTGLVEGTQYSLVFNSQDYSEASFLITYTEELAKSVLNVFMSKDAVDITFTVLETAGDAIQSATVQVSGFVNGTLEVVAEKVTDGVGQVRFNLMPDEPYFFVFSKDDYITNNVNIVTFNTEYTITMQRINVVDFDGPASNVLYTYDPQQETLAPELQTFNWTVVPQSDAQLDEFGIELYFNGSLIASNSLTTSTGGNIQLSYNLSSFENESIQVLYYFTKTNSSRYELSINYEVSADDIPAGSLAEIREWIGDNVTERDKIITWFLITAFVGFLVYLFSEKNGDVTFVGSIIVGAINIWVLNFAVITTMIFVSLILLMFIIYIAQQKRRGVI